jgi:hypothetical protein
MTWLWYFLGQSRNFNVTSHSSSRFGKGSHLCKLSVMEYFNCSVSSRNTSEIKWEQFLSVLVLKSTEMIGYKLGITLRTEIKWELKQ